MKFKYLNRRELQTLTASGQVLSIVVLLVLFALNLLLNVLTRWQFSLPIHIVTVLSIIAATQFLKHHYSFEAERKKIDKEVDKVRASIPKNTQKL